MKLFVTIILLLLTSNIYALEAGKWNFVKNDEYCYIGSLPIDSDLPEGKKRGDTYILVYKMMGQDETIIQIEAGYDYKLENDIIVKIDNASYKFYTVEDVPDTAWTDNDEKIIYAMQKGLELVVTGQSSRGTTTNDKYSLKGFTVASNKLSSDCK